MSGHIIVGGRSLTKHTVLTLGVVRVWPGLTVDEMVPHIKQYTADPDTDETLRLRTVRCLNELRKLGLVEKSGAKGELATWEATWFSATTQSA